MRKKTTMIFGVVTALALVAVNRLDALGLSHYEEPKYKVLIREGAVELREYESVLVAELEIQGSSDDSSARNKAFRILADFIFGKNRSRTKITMTAPVITSSGDSEKIGMTAPVLTTKQDGKLLMKFFMPSTYTKETIPQPLDDRIKIKIEPPRKFAAIRFSGVWNDSRFKEKQAELQRFISARGLQAAGRPVTAFYNPPWTVPFMRRNEILIPIQNAS